MATEFLSSESREEARLKLGEVVGRFQDEIGSPPTLGEFLEIVGLAVPSASDDFDASPGTFRLDAKVGGKRYRPGRDSRVAELNDATFVDASSFLAFIGERVSAAQGHAAPPDDLAVTILGVIQHEDVVFDDVRGTDISSLVATAQKPAAKPKLGDVVAIPVGNSGYRMAVVIARNRFGTAIGLLGPATAHPHLSKASLETAVRKFVYTDDQLFAKRVWLIVGNDDKLLSLFPSDPEIYHGPDPIFPNAQLGEFGAAETAAGVMRQIAKSEAEDVGLLDNSYRQLFVSTYLHQLLADGTI